jgi:hypothetical protein
MNNDDLMKKKEVHYGDIHDCPKSNMIISARMLDKTRRLIQLEYLKNVLEDFGDIPEVAERIGDINEVEEDTIADLKNYITHYENGCKDKENETVVPTAERVPYTFLTEEEN